MAEREAEAAQADEGARGGYRGDYAAAPVADEPIAERRADEAVVDGRGRRGEYAAAPVAGEPVADRRADEAIVDSRGRRGEYVAAPVAGEPVAGEPVVEEPVVVKRGGAAATAALVFGILALVTAFTVVGGVVLGILALIFGAVGSRRAKRGIAYGRGRAIAGILTGLLGIIIAIALAGFFVSLVRGSDAKAMRTCVQHAGFNASAIHSCYKQYHH